MAEEVRPSAVAAQVVRILSSGDEALYSSRFPTTSISDRLLSRILDRLVP